MTDPRIEAAARVVAVPVHTFTERRPADGVPWDCEGCRELAAEVLAAADAVDPLRGMWEQQVPTVEIPWDDRPDD